MVDRLEELLAMMADEDGGEQEDAPAPEAGRAAHAAPAPGNKNRQKSREEAERTEREAASAPMESGELGAAISPVAGERLPEDGPEPEAKAAWRREPADMPERAAAAQMAGKALLETSQMRRGAEQGGEPARLAGREGQSGLEALYRRTAQAGRPPVRNLPAEQAGRTRFAEEPGRAAALTVDELDRAVRRDSRRYDGGITIF